MRYSGVIRWWLTGILLFLPFQQYTRLLTELKSQRSAAFINRLDELTIIILAPVAIWELYRRKELFNKYYLVFLFTFLALIAAGLISGVVNGNPLLVTLHGTFFYIRYPLGILIYAAFFTEYGEFRKLFRILLIGAAFLGAIAAAQEVWALGNKYILQKREEAIPYLEIGTFFLKGVNPCLNEPPWRIGIYRAPSLMINPTYLGLYSVLMLTIYSQLAEKIKFPIAAALFSGIWGSVSRIVYADLIFLSGIHLFGGKRKWALVLILTVVLFSYLSPMPDFLKKKFTPGKPQTVSKNVIMTPNWEYWDSFRGYIREKGIEIWKDHFWFGVGPARYGNILSLQYNSPIYEAYDFDGEKKYYLENFKTGDQFWPLVLAELGTVGAVCFIWLFAAMFFILLKLKAQAVTDDIKGLLGGLMISVVILLFCTYSLDIATEPLITFTFFALAGTGLGVMTNRTQTG